MNNKRILKNIGISMIMKPVSMILSMIYTPMVLNFLGETKYGVWAIILNMITWITIFDIGIGNGLRNKLTESYAIGDEEEAQTYVSTAYLGTTIVSVIFFIVINIVWNLFGLSEFFNLEIGDENVNIVIAVSVFFVCINFILGLSKTSAYAVQKSGMISVTGVIGQGIQILAMFIIANIYNRSLMAVSFTYGCASLVDNWILFKYLTRKQKYLIPRIRKVDISHMKSLMTLGLGFFVMQICSVVLNTTDNLLISYLYGSGEVTPYNMVYKVFYMFVAIHSIIIMPMWSAYTEALARGELQWIRNTLKKINLITALFSIGVLIGVFLFEPFATIWLGRRLEYGRPLIIIAALFMIAQMFANNYSGFLCGIGHIKISTIIAIMGACVNIPLSLTFAQTFGMRLAGIILGSLCVILIGTITLPVIAHRWLKNH